MKQSMYNFDTGTKQQAKPSDLLSLSLSSQRCHQKYCCVLVFPVLWWILGILLHDTQNQYNTIMFLQYCYASIFEVFF